jgi:cell division protein FtsN
MLKFLFGIFSGIIIAAVLAYYLHSSPTPFLDKGLLSTESSNITTTVVRVLNPVEGLHNTYVNPTEESTRYDFYDVLAHKKNLGLVKNAEIKKIIWLQLGAFSAEDLANDLQAKINLLGYSTRINTVIESDISYHRVLVGPFETTEDAQQTAIKLTQQNISSNLVYIKDE